TDFFSKCLPTPARSKAPQSRQYCARRESELWPVLAARPPSDPFEVLSGAALLAGDSMLPVRQRSRERSLRATAPTGLPAARGALPLSSAPSLSDPKYS